jgi:hypothetical protein
MQSARVLWAKCVYFSLGRVLGRARVLSPHAENQQVESAAMFKHSPLSY